MNIDFARTQMIEQQVRAWDVFDPDVLQALKTVPREQFVPDRYRSLAFADVEIPIGHHEVMLTPTFAGRILQALELDGTEAVLDVGTGSGFLAACLATLADTVTSIDIHDDFLQLAARNLDSAGIENVDLVKMDATAELPGGGFDAIAVTGSIEDFDPRFVDALVPGGKLFIVVGKAPLMEARVVERTGDNDWRSTTIFETSLRPLLHGSRPPQFIF
ncbi:MAG: protein-L-isoaspartate O-methyltransferase [Woeseiaceae bacterium]